MHIIWRELRLLEWEEMRKRDERISDFFFLFHMAYNEDLTSPFI